MMRFLFLLDAQHDYDFRFLSSRFMYIFNCHSEAIWLMQGWLFVNAADFWTDTAIEYYLSGIYLCLLCCVVCYL